MDIKEDGLQMDNICISDTCLERSQEYNGYILDTNGIIWMMDYKGIILGDIMTA